MEARALGQGLLGDIRGYFICLVGVRRLRVADVAEGDHKISAMLRTG